MEEENSFFAFDIGRGGLRLPGRLMNGREPTGRSAMRFNKSLVWKAWPLAATLVAALASSSVRADEPSRFGRFLRLGGNPSPPSTSAVSRPSPMPNGSMPSTVLNSPAVTPGTPAGGPAPRLNPQPRNSRPATEADPIVTRVAIGRSDNGSQFGMFLQVFADGTVIDSEGVHRVSSEVLRPVLEAVRQSEIHRQKGHSGAPATDFIELVQIVVYEKSYGKLKATSFSYSGNTQGCDPSVKHLHAALENLQAKMAGQPTPHAGPSPISTTHVPRNEPQGTVIGLTPGR